MQQLQTDMHTHALWKWMSCLYDNTSTIAERRSRRQRRMRPRVWFYLSRVVCVEEGMEMLMSCWKCLFVQSGLTNDFLMADVLRSRRLITAGHRSAPF